MKSNTLKLVKVKVAKQKVKKSKTKASLILESKLDDMTNVEKFKKVDATKEVRILPEAQEDWWL